MYSGQCWKPWGTTLAFKETARTGFYNGAALSSARSDWRSPQWLLERLYTVFTFDLDAAAATPPNVQARVHYNAADDGLFRPWIGCVYANPPYGRSIGAWVNKCHREVASGRARTVIALLPARVGTRWWRENIVRSAAAVFLPGRLRFDDGKNSAPFDAALVLWGASDDEVQQVLAAFEGSWMAIARGAYAPVRRMA
jgi:phage N-6-adenine-methyltransferase